MGRKKAKRRGSTGTFFLGGFIGFTLCLILIVGSLCLIYFKVSANTINKVFKTDIDLKGANDKTLSDIVPSLFGLVQSTDTYKLSDLKEDFGIEIKDTLFGIDIKDLKNVAIDDLGDAVEKKFANISADELRNINGMGLQQDMGDILDQTNKYYYNNADSKLYKNLDATRTPVVYSNEVTFDYELSGDDYVITKGYTSSILSGVVEIPLWYLPLTDALGDFTSNMGENITLHELEEDFGVTLPSFFKNVDKQNTTVNGLESAINSIKVKDILDLNIKSDSSGGKTIYYNDKDNNGTRDEDTEEEVSYVLYSISDKKINELSSTINNFTIAQIFPADQRSTGILSLLGADTKINQISAEIQNVITSTNITTLKEKGVISLNSTDAEKLSAEIDHDKNSETAKVTVGSLTINQLFDYCFDLIPTT